MTRFLPKSLAGQMALLLGIALLIAQAINFAFILNDRQKLSLARNETPAITRFVSVVGDLRDAAPDLGEAVMRDRSGRGARFSIIPAPDIPDDRRDAELEERVEQAFLSAGISGVPVRAMRSVRPRDGPEIGANGPARETLHISAPLPDGTWVTGLMRTPPRDPLLAARLAAATLLLYLLVLGAAMWGGRRIALPLRDLTMAAQAFAGRSIPPRLIPSGPDDLRQAMEAFNAMNGRIVSLLDEKDHLLGAIGHDLRTPLASLRIRIESMEPAEEREAAIAKIDEMSAILEDILVLARTGRARGDVRPMDISALVEAVTEEYIELGKPVTFQPSPRLVAVANGDLLRRAMRNLIDNAITYGGSAVVGVQEEEGRIVLAVKDTGPGVASDDLERILAPFQRLEASRNRNTGGTGLGLAIARSIAESHDGSLTLTRNKPTGLVAALSLPSGSSAA